MIQIIRIINFVVDILIEYFSKSIIIFPNLPKAFCNRRIKLLNTENLPAALEDYQKAIDLGDTLAIKFKMFVIRKNCFCNFYRTK